MFNSILDYVNGLEQGAKFSQDFVKKLRGGRTRLINQIGKAEEQVKTLKDEKKYVAGIKVQLSKEAIPAVKDALTGTFRQAIRENYEFDVPPYRNGMYTAIQDSGTYSVRTRGSGFNSIITVDINLDKTAGRLERWASGVKKYRKILEQEKKANQKKKKGKNKPVKYDPLAASRAWAGIFERREGTFSQFSETVRNRLELSGAIAPFWQLLDKGEIAMSSNRGGYPTPSKKATNFVNIAEQAINEYMKTQMIKEKEKYEFFFDNYGIILDQAKTDLLELNELIEEIRLDTNRILGLSKRQAAIEARNNSNKLAKAVQLIQDGLSLSKRIQVAGKGKYKGSRFSIETIKELL
jgi:hypothetical protein